MFNCEYDLRMYPFDTQICLMEFQVNGIPTRYLELGVEMPEDCPECDGGEYLGNRNLVEYLVGMTVMEDLTNYSAVFGRARVKLMFKRRWVYHLITVFIQSILLLGVAYMTFYFKISNFQVGVCKLESFSNVLYLLGQNHDCYHYNDGCCYYSIFN